MPVKPENRALYPADWDAISLQAKKAAGWRCQHPGCTARQYDVGRWMGNPETFVPFTDSIFLEYGVAKQRAAEVQFSMYGDDPDAPKVIVIVLTTMHLDHDPTNCDPSNLLVACQRHHLRYDAEHHAQSAYMTRMAKRGNLELPL
jgi:hypothetical protein